MFRNAQNGGSQLGMFTWWTIESSDGSKPITFRGVNCNHMPSYSMNIYALTMDGANDPQLCFNLLFLARHTGNLDDSETFKALRADQQSQNGTKALPKFASPTRAASVIGASRANRRVIEILAWTAITELCCSLLAHYPYLSRYSRSFESAIGGAGSAQQPDTHDLEEENARLKSEISILKAALPSAGLPDLSETEEDIFPANWADFDPSDFTAPPESGGANTSVTAKLVYV
jgi:hypothetical protein